MCQPRLPINGKAFAIAEQRRHIIQERLFHRMNVEETRVIDPVCRMELRPEEIRESLAIGDVSYRFCSLGCRAEFERHPNDYVTQMAGEKDRPNV